MARGRRAYRAGYAIAAAIAAIAVACAALLLTMEQRSAPSPAPSAPSAEAPSDGFPVVDWAYWQSVNPDVIGWATVPGTAIDYPIVQAQEDDPTYYLTHDVYGEYNIYGCPYLDAGCIGSGLDSPVSVVFGHHMNDGSMFADFASYSDAGFMEGHRTVLLQTPDWKRVLSASAADVTPGYELGKRTSFEDASDLAVYLGERYDACDASLCAREEFAAQERICMFVTCSYNRWSNERTLVWAWEQE